jgi:hypothetical protein
MHRKPMMTSQSSFSTKCDDQASSHPMHTEGCNDLPCYSFLKKENQTTFLMEKVSFNIFREHEHMLLVDH